MGVAIAVKRDLDAVQAERQHAIDDVAGQQQAVRDDVGVHRHAARLGGAPEALGQQVHDRKVQQRLAAEERQPESLRPHPIELALDPVADTRGRGDRHFFGALVVVPVIALKAVVAREIALQRRQERDAQLGLVALDVGEVLIERAVLGFPVGDQESVLPEQAERVACLIRDPVRRSKLTARNLIEQARHIG